MSLAWYITRGTKAATQMNPIPLLLVFSGGVAGFFGDQTEGLLEAMQKLGDGKFSGRLQSFFLTFQDSPAKRLFYQRGIPVVTTQRVGQDLARSFISVCPSQTLIGMTCICKTRYHDIAFVEDRDNEAMAVLAADMSRNQIVVAYRPTITLMNWIYTIDFKMVQMKDAPRGVMVHRGFHRIHASLVDKLFVEAKKLLDQPKYSKFSVQLTGYSLGGAIALMATPDWQRFLKRNQYRHPLMCFSYSSPRVGNERFAQYVASARAPVVRYTNYNDVIPHLPPRLLNFTHAGVEYHYRDGQLKMCRQDYDEDPNCALKYTFPLSFIQHYYPSGNLVSHPPYC